MSSNSNNTDAVHGAELDKSWSGRCDDLTRAAERQVKLGVRTR